MVPFREPNIDMNVLWHWLLPQKFGDSQRSPNCSSDLASVHSIRLMFVIVCVVKHIRVLGIVWCSFLLNLCVCLKLLRFHMLVCLFSVNGCEMVGIFYLLQREHGLMVELLSCFWLSITSSYAYVCPITWWRKSSTSWCHRWMLSQGCWLCHQQWVASEDVDRSVGAVLGSGDGEILAILSSLNFNRTARGIWDKLRALELGIARNFFLWVLLLLHIQMVFFEGGENIPKEGLTVKVWCASIKINNLLIHYEERTNTSFWNGTCF